MIRKAYDPASRWIAIPVTTGGTRVITVDRVVEYRSGGSGAVVTVRGFDGPGLEDISTPEALDAFEVRFFAALRAEGGGFGPNRVCGSPC